MAAALCALAGRRAGARRTLLGQPAALGGVRLRHLSLAADQAGGLGEAAVWRLAVKVELSLGYLPWLEALGRGAGLYTLKAETRRPTTMGRASLSGLDTRPPLQRHMDAALCGVGGSGAPLLSLVSAAR